MRGELAFGTGLLSREEAVRHARAFAHPAWAREMPDLPYVDSTGDRPRTQSLLRIEGEGVELSAFKPGREEGTSVLRLYNRTGRTQAADLRLGWPASRYCSSTLREKWTDEGSRPVRDGTITLNVEPHEIRTVLIR
jgi:alpha-mannosidase